MSNAGKKTGKNHTEEQAPGPEAQPPVSADGVADAASNSGDDGNQAVGDVTAAASTGGNDAAGQSVAAGAAASLDAEPGAGQDALASDAGGNDAPPLTASGEQLAEQSTAGAPSGEGSSDLSVAIGKVPAPLKPTPVNPAEVEVFPLRTYQDAGELRRRGGKGYTVDRRHAEALVQRGLASLEPPEE